jgi:DNA-nicking Smr family endonuclease
MRERALTDTEPEPHRLPIDGTLDLHTFQPRETKYAVAAYIDACLEAGIYLLRVIHGKGKGVQREIVRSVLERHPQVESFRTDTGAGSWGATLVNLKRPNDSRSPGRSGTADLT